MVFKNKFFLDLSSGDEQQKPATIAPPTARPAEPAGSAAKAKASTAVNATDVAASAPAAAPATSQTTAEAIAAELAAAQASRPAPTLATFSPECVSAGGALPRRRRRGGADLGGFKEMARDMMRS